MKFKSCKEGILGLALADAMGVPVEFCDRDYLKTHPITKVVGYGTYNQPAGSFSDDTSLTLALMDGVIKSGGIINEEAYKNIANNFGDYLYFGAFTPLNRMFDVGGTTSSAINNYLVNKCKPYEAGGNKEHNKGNGALMRILPVAYYAYNNGLSEEETFDITKKVASITHRLDTCVLGSYIYVEFAKALLEGKSKEEAYKHIQHIDYLRFVPEDVRDEYIRVLDDNIADYPEYMIDSKGKTVESLEASMWSFMKSDSYSDTILTAINLGKDTDTVGAIAGGVAGLYYGIDGDDGIPEKWLSMLIKRDYIEDLSKAFDEAVLTKTVPVSFEVLKRKGNPRESSETAQDILKRFEEYWSR